MSPSASHDLQAQHVVGRHAVGEAVRPAGVLGDVAADGAGALARRVGRVVEAVLGDRLAQVEVDHARLDQRRPVLDVDLEDALHARHRDEHAADRRDGAAAEPGTGAARHHRQVVLAARSSRPPPPPAACSGTRRPGAAPLDRPVVLEDDQVLDDEMTLLLPSAASAQSSGAR